MTRRIPKHLQRKPKRRHIPIDLIVCEGETEVDYLRELAKHNRINVDIKKSKGSDPLSIVKTAKKGSKNYDKIYCVFDKDNHNDNFTNAIEFCKNLRFIPIISNPCIELWFLKHFIQRQSALGGAEEALKALLKHIPSYDKDGVLTFYETYHLLDIACKNARKLLSRQQDQYHRDPYTNVDQLVLRFDELQKL